MINSLTAISFLLLFTIFSTTHLDVRLLLGSASISREALLLLQHLFVLDVLRYLQEALMHILAGLGRSLEEAHVVLFRQSEALLRRDHLVFLVTLRGHQHLFNVRVRILVNLLHPVGHVLKG